MTTDGAIQDEEPRSLGTAQQPRTEPWRKNDEGPRTAEEAVAIARRWGVIIPEDIRLVFRDDLGNLDALAEYGGFQSFKPVRWLDFYAKGKIPVKIRPSVLQSDEAIVAVLGHEMHELNALREMFETRETMECAEIRALLRSGLPGNLHDRAWDAADELVLAMRREAAT